MICIVSNSLGSDTTNIARLRVVDGYYSITIITTGKGEVRAFGDSSLVGIPLNSSRTLFFKPDSGYRIKEIAIDGTLSDSARRSTEYTFSSINKNHTCVVSFEPIPSVKHLLSVIVDTTKGSVIRSITADSIIAGTEVTLTAIPKEYYRFPGWTGDTTSGQNPLILQVNANRSLTAVFTGDTAIYKKPLSPIMSINTEIYRATASASNQVTLVPKSGLYDDGTLEAVGALDIVIRK